MTFLRHPVIVISDEEHARMACDELVLYLDAIKRLTVVHITDANEVVHSVVIHQQHAPEYFSYIESRLGGSIEIETDMIHSWDAVSSTIEAATEVEADSIVVFGDGLDVEELVAETDRPVVFIP